MKTTTPKLRLHATGQYFVQWGGRVKYLGSDPIQAQDRYLDQLQQFARWVADYYKNEKPIPIQKSVTPNNENEKKNDRSMSFSKAVQLFLKNRGSDIPDVTLKFYRKNLNRLLALQNSDCQIGSVTLQTVIDWKNRMIEEGYSPKTIKHTLTSLRTFWRHLVSLGHAKPLDLSIVSGPTLEPPENKALPLDVLKQEILHAKAVRPVVGLLIELQLLLGCRPSEIPRLFQNQGEWIGTLPYRVFALSYHKTRWKRQRRYLVFSERAWEIYSQAKVLMARQSRASRNTGCLWQDGYYYGVAVSDIVGHGPGVYRHSSATLIVRALGYSRSRASEYLGHAVGAVSLSYISPTELFEQNKEIAEKLSCLLEE